MVIKGFTTYGHRVIDLTPVTVQRTIGTITVREAPQQIARIIEHPNAGKAAYTLDRLRRPATSSSQRLSTYEPLRVSSYADLKAGRF